MKTIRYSLVVVIYVMVAVVNMSSVFSQSSVGFSNDEDLFIGSLVSFKTENATELVPANVNNQKSLIGVVIERGQSVYGVEEDNSNVSVTAEGVISTLVSNINGDIKAGDYISTSQINGVGMRADEGKLSKRIVGIAISDFDESSRTAFDLGELGLNGVEVARIPVQLLIGGSVDNDDAEESLITQLGERVVGKPVTFFQATIAILLFFLTLSVSSVLLYGAIIGSFTSLGRNPLAAKVIVKNLIRVTFISLLILLVGIGAAYGTLLI